jgi:hypothetical protein
MYYRGSLIIPAGTLRSNPATTVVSLTYGRINELCIVFPPGQSGLCHLAVLYHEKQIFPTSVEQDFIGDDTLLVFPDRFPIYDEPFEVKLLGWSPSATLDHIVYISFVVEPEEKVTVAYSGSVALPTSVLRARKG